MDRGIRTRIAVVLVVAAVIALGIAAAMRDFSQANEERVDEARKAQIPKRETKQLGGKLPPLELPAGADVVVVGDSWSTGYAADVGQGYVDLLAAQTGWDITVTPNAPGSGWLARGPEGQIVGTFRERLEKSAADPDVDLLIIHGGLNDNAPLVSGEAGDTGLNEAVRRTVRTGRETYPNAKVLVIGPFIPQHSYFGAIPTIDEKLRFEATINRYYYVSPWTERWFGRGKEMDPYINEQLTNHPNNAGHALFAERLLEDLQQLEAEGQRLKVVTPY